MLDHRTREVRLLGATMHLVTQAELTSVVASAARARRQCIVANHNLHSLYLLKNDLQFREFFVQAEWIHADGMSLVAIAQLLGYPARTEHRTTYVDWAPDLFKLAADSGLRVFYLGSKPTIADRGAVLLRARHPELVMETSHGYFDGRSGSAENEAVLARICDFRPNILMVGMGMPRQERWIREHLERLPPCVILTTGACIDYIAGEVPSPPRWMGRAGLEWLYRLLAEPRRLAFRYLVEPWSLAPLLARDLWNSRIRGRR